MGLWSMAMILFSCSTPSMPSWAPARWRLRFSVFESDLYRISFTSDDLPLPDTPVTQVMTPRGSFTSMFFRLLVRAPHMVSQPAGSRRDAGMGTNFFPDRYCPVRESGFAMICSGVPSATISPPWMPAPGPTSTIQSASSMVSSSCSTTISVLPRSRRPFRLFSSRRLSRWCRPMEGSSSMYSTPTRPLPIWVASRMRWASPPDSVPALRDRVR